MELAAQKHERAVLKVILWSGFCLLVLIGLGIGGTHAYHTWAIHHSLGLARGYMNGGDYRLAALSARHAIDIDQDDPDAARIMAEIAQHQGDKSELDWRRKVVRQRPSSVQDRLDLANCAIRFKDIVAAKEALEAVSDDGKKTPAFVASRARLIAATGDKAQAELLWTRATEMAPDNSSYKLELALAKLAIGQPKEREVAGAILEALRTDPKQRAAATRALINDGVAHQERAETILQWARELQSYPEALFDDRLLYLDMLRQMRHPDFTGYLTKVENAAAEVPTNLAALLSWMNRTWQSTLALDFANRLPPEKIRAWPVPLAVADSYANLNAWDRLERFLADTNWKDFDFVRRAYLARVYRAEDKPILFERVWSEAEKDAATQAQKLSLLTKLVSELKWDKETNELLWQLAKFPETQSDALRTLYQQSMNKRDTAELYSVLVRMAELNPNDPVVQNNLALVALLLNADTDRAHKIALGLHEKDPTNAAFAATYAYSLFTKGKIDKALEVMASLPDERLHEPSIALYYGIFLTAAGSPGKARPFLELASHAPMLSEEKTLLQNALQKLPSSTSSG